VNSVLAEKATRQFIADSSIFDFDMVENQRASRMMEFSTILNNDWIARSRNEK
jgi:hypothetical protein